MGRSIVDTVLDALQSEGISACRAMPSAAMGAPSGIAAAVQLHRLDQKEKTAEVLVTVLSPADRDASVCENGALQIFWILQRADGVCRQERTVYQAETDCFCTEVYALFSGEETENGWSPVVAEPEAEFSVFVGNATDSAAILFTARRAVDETVTVLGDAIWRFRLEERFALEESEPAWPAEPFSITVVREGGTEVYSGCVATSQKRSLDKTGQLQIREGTAQTMTVVR